MTKLCITKLCMIDKYEVAYDKVVYDIYIDVCIDVYHIQLCKILCMIDTYQNYMHVWLCTHIHIHRHRHRHRHI